MNTVRTVEFINRIAKEKGLPTSLVREIVRAQFDFLATTMKSGDRENMVFKSVMLPKFGKFTSTSGIIYRIKKLNEGKLKKYGTTELGVRKVKRVPGKSEYQGV